MGNSLTPITITASATMDRHIHRGTNVLLSAAAGLTVSLPAATGTGDIYKFFVATTVTSNAYIIAANGTDIMAGGVSMSTDIGGTNILAIATADYITMNGSTTGGLKGSWVDLEDVATGLWKVGGFLVSTGTEATPFAAT
jgi:hypothetical protein